MKIGILITQRHVGRYINHTNRDKKIEILITQIKTCKWRMLVALAEIIW